MPETNYMVVDARSDHSFRVPRPDLALNGLQCRSGSDRGRPQHQNDLNPLLCQTPGKTGTVHPGGFRQKVICRYRVVIVLAEFRGQTLLKISPDGRILNQHHHSGLIDDNFLGYGDVQREDTDECDESNLPDHGTSGVVRRG